MSDRERHIWPVEVKKDRVLFAVGPKAFGQDYVEVRLYPGDSVEWGPLRGREPFEQRDGMEVEYIGRTRYGYLRAHVTIVDHGLAPRCTSQETSMHCGTGRFWSIGEGDEDLTISEGSRFSREAAEMLRGCGLDIDSVLSGGGEQDPYSALADSLEPAQRHWVRENGHCFWPWEGDTRSMSRYHVAKGKPAASWREVGA